jgi:carbamoyltransferase
MSAALIKDGELIAAVEEERFNRKKHWAGFPTESIKYCLPAAGICACDLDHIGTSRDPSAHLHKKVLYSVRNFSRLSGLVAARLANAAKVRNLKDELATALQITAPLRAQFYNVPPVIGYE